MPATTFTVTDDHLRLLDRINIGYDDSTEFGAPEVDPKRPYGNSDVYGDIGEILGVQPDGEDDWGPEFSDAQRERFRRIHRDMETVLQILVRHRSIRAGVYRRSSPYGVDWAPAATKEG